MTDPVVEGLGPRKIVARWPAEIRDLWSERAAIMEFDGEMSREAAELAAYYDIWSQYSTFLKLQGHQR